jgi:hypothetical protein
LGFFSALPLRPLRLRWNLSVIFSPRRRRDRIEPADIFRLGHYWTLRGCQTSNSLAYNRCAPVLIGAFCLERQKCHSGLFAVRVNAKSLDHSIERSPIDTQDLCSSGSITTR